MSLYAVLDFRRRANFFSWPLSIIVLTASLASTQVLARNDVGATIPRHVEVPIGANVNITCRMNISHFNEKNSSCLTFSKEYSNATIPKEHIHIVNETSIVFMIRNATEQSIRYVCKCDKNGVDVTNVDVGTKPTDVTDFKCRGYDFSYMICNFTVPENKIYTHYKLKFSLSTPGYTYECVLENGALLSHRFCNMSLDNKTYRIVHQYYNFELTANNSLGNLTQRITIDQYRYIIPERPAIKVENISTSSVTLSWEVTKYSHYGHTNGLQYEIRLRPEKFGWFDTNFTLVTKFKDNWAHIDDLEYAFRRYDFSVRVKGKLARNDSTMWSEPFYGTFETKPRRPDNPPAIDVGSFYIDPTEQNIRIYWQQLPEYRENGPGFEYVITEIKRDGNMFNISPVQMDHTSITYQWQSTSKYEFKIKSQNQVGPSLNTSVLIVSPSRDRSIKIEQIQMITKVYHNQTYTISWRLPIDMDNLIDFTVFWCTSKMESQSQCKGTINFRHFDKYTYNYTTEPQNHTLNFAVSANYRTDSTGMIWAMCTADVGTDLTKMDPETTPISSNSLKVQWSTECLYTAILEGYNLTYCKVENNTSEIGDCISAEKTISISKMAKEYILEGLEPFTTYKISMFMYSKAKVGPMSSPVFATTTEDAPTPPRKLKYYNVTSNSAVISWVPPNKSNGNLRYYTVWQNNIPHIVNSTINNGDSKITFKLEDLSSFSEYKIYVTAHTVKSSVPSNDVHLKTLIGPPSTPRSLNITKGDDVLILNWAKPTVPSGRVEFYEVRIIERTDNGTKTYKISRVVNTFCKINLPPCYDQSFLYTFDVRAVNVAEKSEVDYHTFSKRDTTFYTTLHQGAAKRRRHSNAEINSSIGGAYQIHDIGERHLRHRHERENLKTESTTTESAKAFEPFEFIHDYSNDEWMCLNKQNLQHYDDPNQYKRFNSAWENSPFYACGKAQLNKKALIGMAIGAVLLIIITFGYIARKKYNKMSNIGLVIPEGLDENIHIPKGVDNTIERDEISRIDDHFYEKENHSLLSKIDNGSSSTCLDKNNAYECSDHQDSEKSSQSTDTVELNDIPSCSYTSSPSHSPNANVRETITPEEKCTSPINQANSVQLRPSDNGYIKPMMTSNGYVPSQAFQKINRPYNGYTSLDDMGKPMFTPQFASAIAPIGHSSFGILDHKVANNKDIAPAQPMNGNICGYVTHKQLYDYGQQ